MWTGELVVPAGYSMFVPMTDGVTVLFGAVGAVAAMLAVLVPVIRAQGGGPAP